VPNLQSSGSAVETGRVARNCSNLKMAIEAGHVLIAGTYSVATAE